MTHATHSRTNSQPAPETGPLNTAYQCCHQKCICSKLHHAFETLSTLATVMLHDLERGGPILLDDETSPRTGEETLGRETPPPPKKKLMFPRYWGYIRFVQAVISLFTMIVFAVYIQRSRVLPTEVVLLVFSIIAMIYSAFLGYVRLIHRDWCPWLLTFAPLIFIADMVILSMQIVTFVYFPKALRGDYDPYYYYRRRIGRIGFDNVMWIPMVTINFLLYILTAAIALYITYRLFYQETYIAHFASAQQTYRTQKSKEKHARELVKRILDGTLVVVPAASRSEETTRVPNQTQPQVGYVAATQSTMALVETGESQSHVIFPAGPSHRQEVPTSATTFHVNHTSSRPSKFTLTTQEHDPRADSHGCCRMCGEHGLTNPPDYIHTTVAGLPQIPLVPHPTNAEVRRDDGDDEATENTGLLKGLDMYQ